MDAVAEFADDLARNGGGVQDSVRFGEEGRACLREPDALCGALEQQDAEIALEGGDSCGHGALHDVQAPCGPGEALLAGDGGEVFQLPQFHKRPPPPADQSLSTLLTMVSESFACLDRR